MRRLCNDTGNTPEPDATSLLCPEPAMNNYLKTNFEKLFFKMSWEAKGGKTIQFSRNLQVLSGYDGRVS